jgi:hypothetical protein
VALLPRLVVTFSHDISQIYSHDVPMLVKYYTDWGPSIRVCLNLIDGAVSPNFMETAAARAARRLVKSTENVPTMETYDPADASNILFSIHPANKSRSDMLLVFATDHILDIILAEASRLDAVAQSRFFSMISGHPWLKTSLGHFDEKLMHVRLTVDPDALPLLLEMNRTS